MIPMMPMVLITLMMPLMLMMLVMLAMAPMLARGHRRCLRAGVAADGGSEPGGAEELPTACVLKLLAMVAASRAATWLGCRADASAEGAWGQSSARVLGGPAAEDAICGSVRSSGPKMRALARRINSAGRAGTHASASRTGKSGRGACSGAKESGGAFGAAAGAEGAWGQSGRRGARAE